ncbi:hypothetical protein M8C21_016580 [Ambrosia artemisiifolia]|uniref:CCT domain-containing protein n=1 Tax=Ambrosia artemisiifolia TaxID=4212 RepID=A0AAD5CMP3_AMBAR|nr:hypothetical protein M8C21_016580 [Ambrosia artemisiifolia]
MTNHRTKFVKTLPIVQEQVSSPLSAQLLELCESDLFQEPIQNSKVVSSSNRCYEEQSSLTINPSLLSYCPAGVDNITTTSTTTTTTTTTNDFSLMFEDKITPIDLTNASHFTNNQCPFSNQDQFDLSLLQNENQINDPIFSYPCTHSNDQETLVGPTTLLNINEQDIISPMLPSKFMLQNNMLSSKYPLINPSMSSNLLMPTEDENLFLGNDIQIHELEFHGDNNGIFCTDHLPHSFNSNDFQAFSNESQHLMNGCGSSMTPLPSEITSLESESMRVTNKLTSEERKEKINKYMKKRNERNFNKKIKYACRKTLADSRPRVRGRFAKHDEFGENNRSNHEEDTDEDEHNFHEVVKEEEENFESSDILAHISGVNSFKSSYPIQSWI